MTRKDLSFKNIAVLIVLGLSIFILGCKEGGLRGYTPLEEPEYSRMKYHLEKHSVLVNSIKIGSGSSLTGAIGGVEKVGLNYFYFDITLNSHDWASGQQKVKSIVSEIRIADTKNIIKYPIHYATIQFHNPDYALSDVRIRER